MKSVGIAIISWPEFEEQALKIEAEVSAVADKVVVLHDGLQGQSLCRRDRWIVFPPESYFAPKFEWAINNLETDVLLFIVADTSCGDWQELVRGCREAFSSDHAVAVWAPRVEETWWNSEKIVLALREGDTGLQDVIAVDSIVWAITWQIACEVRKLDYSRSRFGWGIEAVCAALARCSGKLVVRDTRLEVDHRRGTTYSVELANEEAQKFYEQLEPSTRVMVAIVEEFALLRTIRTPATFSLKIRRRWGSFRDLVYSRTIKRWKSEKV